jgi:hypothetical protein
VGSVRRGCRTGEALNARVGDRHAVVGLLVAAGLSVGLLAARILGAGYGADNDTFGMLGTWDVLRAEGRYVPSRYQGYPLAELGIGSSSEVGGHWLSGLVSLVLGCACVALTYHLVRRRTRDLSFALTCAAVLATTPVFVIAASTSVDYLYGLAAFLAGWTLWERRSSWIVVAALLGLAAAARISYLPLGVLLILMAPRADATRPRRSVTVVVAVSIAFLAYVPSLRSPQGGLRAFRADRPTDEGWLGVAVRAIVKGTDVFGLIGSLVLVVGLVAGVRSLRRRSTPMGGERWLLVLLAVLLLLWIWLPVEPSYLLPAVVVFLVWLSSTSLASNVRPVLTGLVACLVLYGWVDAQALSFTYASRYGHGTCDATRATSATIGFHLEAGPLLGYPDEVHRTADCNQQVRRSMFDI